MNEFEFAGLGGEAGTALWQEAARNAAVRSLTTAYLRC